mgnify:CR=1 FL=1
MYLEIEGAERYRAALYIRLSREDETDGPSESVSNQRAMLEDFARQRGVPVSTARSSGECCGTLRPDG